MHCHWANWMKGHLDEPQAGHSLRTSAVSNYIYIFLNELVRKEIYTYFLNYLFYFNMFRDSCCFQSTHIYRERSIHVMVPN